MDRNSLTFQFLKNPFSVGACCPSSPFLAQEITSFTGLENVSSIVELGPGKLMEAGATEGFIIQYVNEHQVKTPQDVIDVVKKSKRTVFIEGVTPSGRTGYFGFGI